MDPQKIYVCAPLLADLWRELEGWRDDGRIGSARGILLLNTARDGGRFRDQEPVAILELVREELARRFDIDPEEIVQCNYLVGDEELYQQDAYGQRHLHVAAAKRIDDAIRQLQRRHPGAMALVSTVGGIPEVKAVVAASARYRFRQRVRFVNIGERRTETAVGCHIVALPPAESLTDRLHIAHLIQHGAFDAAAKLAGMVSKDLQQAEPWRLWLIALAGWLSGDRSIALEAKRGLEGESEIEKAMNKLQEPALIVAFRVENHLRCANWPAALRETFSFLEISRLRRIQQELSASEQQPCVDKWVNKFFPQNVRQDLQYKLPPHLVSDKPIPINSTRGHAKNPLTALVKTFDEELSDVLQLQTALKPLRYSRNKEAHIGLTPDDIERVRRIARPRKTTRTRQLAGGIDRSSVSPAAGTSTASSSALWSDEPPYFLENPWVHSILKNLGVPSAARQYDELVEAVLHDMDTYSFREQV